MKLSYVYILKCSDKTYYTGITSDLNKRLTEHQQGKHIESYTYNQRPVKLVFYAELLTSILQSKPKKGLKNGRGRKRKR